MDYHVMEAEGIRLLREKQQLKIPQEATFNEGRLRPSFADNVDIPLVGAPSESDYLKRTSYTLQEIQMDPVTFLVFLCFFLKESLYITYPV